MSKTTMIFGQTVNVEQVESYLNYLRRHGLWAGDTESATDSRPLAARLMASDPIRPDEI